MSIADAHANFADVVGAVNDTNEPVILEKRGRPLAVMISPEQYERYQEQVKERFFRAVDQIQQRNEDKDPDEVLREVTAIVEEVRQQHYEREQRRRAE